MVDLKQTERFHKNKEVIRKVILNRVDNNEIIHGQSAVNKQIPKHLHRTTTDYDIFSTTPKKDAREAERALDRRFGFNAFETIPGQHKGTYKVKSRVDGETYADYTKPEKTIPSKKIGGKRYATLGYFKRHITKTLKDPEASFRHIKDRDTLNRILLAEQKPKKKKKLTIKEMIKRL